MHVSSSRICSGRHVGSWEVIGVIVQARLTDCSNASGNAGRHVRRSVFLLTQVMWEQVGCEGQHEQGESEWRGYDRANDEVRGF
jgi:hypothetical protein